ncbi:MAG: hypothetical protein IKE55_02185 [Kiritimatiellae bacterium]|nr:hypothetical protein [Kiritimatiellia bacterium]
MKKMLKIGAAALALAAVSPAFAEADVETESEYEAVGWTPIALGIASPVQIPWGRAMWDVFGLDFNIIYSDAPKMYGLGIGGIAMATRDTMGGIQVSALCNWASADVYGIRTTLGGNFAYGTTYGLEGGLFGYRSGEFWGWDTEFLGSYGDYVWGCQVAGICNIMIEQSYGAAIAIGGNYAKKAYGLQLGAIFNFTDELHGCQIGLVNYARECPWGFQLGLVNMIMDNRIKVLPILNFYF